MHQPLLPNPDYDHASPLTPGELEAVFQAPADAIIGAAERQVLSVQHWLPTRVPGVKVRSAAGTTLISSPLPDLHFNQAVGASYDGMPGEEVDREIEAVRDFFTAHKMPWRWWVPPSAVRADFGKRLAAQGITPQRRLPTMAARLPAASRPRASSIRVWTASDRSDLSAASAIRREALHFTGDAGLTYFEDGAVDWLAGDPARLYLASEEDNLAPAAVGALIMAEGIPGIYAMATLPSHERRGLGRAILDQIMATAADENHRMIVLNASPQGFGLYRKLGFEYIADFILCEYPGLS